jgi:hypothetical protein
LTCDAELLAALQLPEVPEPLHKAISEMRHALLWRHDVELDDDAVRADAAARKPRERAPAGPGPDRGGRAAKSAAAARIAEVLAAEAAPDDVPAGPPPRGRGKKRGGGAPAADSGDAPPEDFDVFGPVAPSSRPWTRQNFAAFLKRDNGLITRSANAQLYMLRRFEAWAAQLPREQRSRDFVAWTS